MIFEIKFSEYYIGDTLGYSAPEEPAGGEWHMGNSHTERERKRKNKRLEEARNRVQILIGFTENPHSTEECIAVLTELLVPRPSIEVSYEIHNAIEVLENSPSIDEEESVMRRVLIVLKEQSTRNRNNL